MAGLTDLFADTIRETSETALGGKNGYRNLVQAAKYTTSYLMGGKTPEEILHTGQVIRDTFYLKSEDTGKRFGGAGLRFDWENRQVGTKVTTQMSFYANYLGWDELELDLNADMSMGQDYVRAKFNDILTGKYQNLTQSCVDQFEGECWAQPNQATMRTDYTAPMSLPYFMTEETDGIPLQADASGLSDVLGLSGGSGGTYTKWDNQRATYAAVGGSAADGNDVIGSLLHASNLSTFEPLPINPEHGVDASAPNVVFCSHLGMRYVVAALRGGQDTWGKRELGYGMVIGNMYFRNVDELTNAALYVDTPGTGLETEEAADVTGPRYWGVSKKAMRPLFMKNRYMEPGDVTNLTADGKPNEYVQVFKTYNQLTCNDRRKLFIVSPFTDL